MSQTILITGATAGIGEAAARLFAKHNYRLILTGRRKERLQALEKELGVEVLSLVFDVRDQEAVKAAVASIPEDWRDIDILVNNAGLAVGLEPIHEGVVDDWERMIDTNVKGLLYISREISPWMVARKQGHIINIASIAGKQVYKGGGVYCASKHAADALSQGMRIDLLPYGIRVTNVAPGMVDTEFSVVRFKGDQEKADGVYNGLAPLTGHDIAEVVYYVATTPAHVCINDIVVMPTAQASAYYTHREG